MKPARVAKILYKRYVNLLSHNYIHDVKANNRYLYYFSAVSGKIKNAPQGTINRLLNSRC